MLTRSVSRARCRSDCEGFRSETPVLAQYTNFASEPDHHRDAAWHLRHSRGVDKGCFTEPLFTVCL
eukprot:5773007-Pyramimonas_sp.AAC.1